jgi:16S rRNA (guanine527-N7)-methyltransferase
LETLLKYYQDLSENQIRQFAQAKDLYIEWNEKINLISRKDINFLYERHILHSLAIAKIIRFKPSTTILDIGTGGGFPGIPLAILFPESNFVLIDSIRKKIKAVQEIIHQLNIKNTEARHLHSNELKQKFDFIVSRAVTAFPQFIKFTKDKVKPDSFNSLPNGILYLKGGDIGKEIQEFSKLAIIHQVSDFFTEDFFKEKYVVYYPLK